MQLLQHISISSFARGLRQRIPLRRSLAVLAAILFGTLQHAPSASAQTGIVANGNAVVTGFSGVAPPAQIAPGANPADTTLIDATGASLRVIDLQAFVGVPAGDVVTAPKPFAATAAQIGQVFGVTLDKASPPNIYAAATSVYGLPITGPDGNGDGQPDRLKQGAANAAFMAGLFGPSGGPGSIWKIDGTTGAATLFATVTLNGAANPGPALGALAFDPVSNAILVADRATGMIHRFDLTGQERGRYDHGTQGRSAAGQPPAAYDPAHRLDLTNPAFHPDDPATWQLAPPARRVFALAVQAGRLFYSVADGLQIWSVALAPDGSFGTDPRLELTVPPGAVASEIASIAFDDRGRMVLAERVAPSGAYDFNALTIPGGGRVLRFDPASGGAERWQLVAGDPPTGIDPVAHGDGGVAIGFGYDATGQRNAALCSGSLWWTGEQLGTAGGAQAVNGLSGRPDDAAAAWLIDLDERLDDPQSRGWIGAIALLRNCGQAVAGGPGEPGPGPSPGPAPGPGGEPSLTPPLDSIDSDFAFEPWWWPDGFQPPPPPPALCPPGTHLANGLRCCPTPMVPGPNGVCRSPCPDGSVIPADMAACRAGFKPGIFQCWNNSAPVAGKCPKPPHAQCPSNQLPMITAPPAVPNPGWIWSNATCSLPKVCPFPQQIGFDGLCHPGVCPGPGQTATPVRQCCLNGTSPDPVTGQCAPGLFVPQPWYLTYLATGSSPCPPPYTWCSFYQFTITGQTQFGRGRLEQRITLPAGSAFPEAKVVRGSRYCPASAWSCGKSGDGFLCRNEDCGLAPGDQVVIRLEGKVAPNMTETLTAPVEKTACGRLSSEPFAGRGSAITAERDVLQQAQENFTRQDGKDGKDGSGHLVGRTQEACWSIVLLPSTDKPACATGYSPTADGQCCLARNMTARGVCCPAGQRPDPQRNACVATTTVPTGVIPLLVRTCAPDETGVWPNCCPRGRYWNGKRCITPQAGECPPDSIGKPPACRCRPPLGGLPGHCTRPPCPEGFVGTPPNCHKIELPCPPGTVGKPPRCRKIVRTCPDGMIGTPPNCRKIERRCPPGMVGTPPECRRIVRTCPPGLIGTPPNCRRPPVLQQDGVRNPRLRQDFRAIRPTPRGGPD